MFPQSTVVVERWYQVPLSKKGSPPRLHPRRHRIYKLVEDIKHAPKEKMELILTQTVPSESLRHCSLNRSQKPQTVVLSLELKKIIIKNYKVTCFCFDRARWTRRHCVGEKVCWQKQTAASRPRCVSITGEQTDVCGGVKSTYRNFILSLISLCMSDKNVELLITVILSTNSFYVKVNERKGSKHVLDNR